MLWLLCYWKFVLSLQTLQSLGGVLQLCASYMKQVHYSSVPTYRIESAKASAGVERIAVPSKALVATGESKTPFSQGIVPRKAPTMPKPEWHAPWKLMRVSSFDYLPFESE